MDKAVTLVVVRHGKSAHNLGSERQHTFAGSKIDNSLSPEGVESTHKLSKKIIEDGIPDLIVFSGLKRSKETAEIVAQDIKNLNDINIKKVEIPELNEINIGDFASHTEEEVKSLFPKSANSFYSGDIGNWSFPDGENYLQVMERVCKVLEKITTLATAGQRVLISGHGMINRVLFFMLEPENVELWKPRKYPHEKIVQLKYYIKS